MAPDFLFLDYVDRIVGRIGEYHRHQVLTEALLLNVADHLRKIPYPEDDYTCFKHLYSCEDYVYVFKQLRFPGQEHLITPCLRGMLIFAERETHPWVYPKIPFTKPSRKKLFFF